MRWLLESGQGKWARHPHVCRRRKIRRGIQGRQQKRSRHLHLCKRQHIRWGIQGRRAKRARRFLRCEWFNQAVGYLERQQVLWSGCPLNGGGKIVENGHRALNDPDRRTPRSVLQQILGRDLAEDFAGAAVFRRDYLGAEADRARTAAGRDDLLEAGEGTAAYEQNISGVNLQEFLLRMLAAPLRRYRRHGAFHDFQQRLLHALARHVAGDRRTVRLAADLVDFVDIDDTALGLLDVIVGRLQQLENDVLDVLADITGFGERRRIRHGERHVENASERLRQQGLAGAGRADQQDVRFRKFDVFVLGLVIEPLVMIVDGDREDLLGVVLPDHVAVEDLSDLLRRRDAVLRFHQRGLLLLSDDVHAKLDAFVADEHGRAGNDLAHLVLALTAERAMERLLGLSAVDLAHLRNSD